MRVRSELKKNLFFAGHAMNWIKETSDLNFRYSGIITISGDGLIHEVYNGLWQRRDWEDMCDFPLGIVPGGSGNALNCSLLRQLGQPLDGTQHLGATWSGCNVAQGASEKKTVALDLMEVDLADGQKRISFFGVTIGLVADVDIGSEALRCVGTLSKNYSKCRILIFYCQFWHFPPIFVLSGNTVWPPASDSQKMTKLTTLGI